jgi:hypothetical protein
MNAIARRKMLVVIGAGLVAPSMIASAMAQAPVPETAAGLQQQLGALYAAVRDKDEARGRVLISALRLPNADAWFRRVFGDEAGARLGAEYATATARLDAELGRLFAKVIEKGQSEIRTLRFDRADDPKAVGNQKDTMAAMKSPQALYSARFVKPGEGLGMHLYSFVYADGMFRLAGKMESAKAS